MNAICIRCGEPTVSLDLDGGDTMRCRECEAEFTVADVEAAIRSWETLIPWIKSCPARQGHPVTRKAAS